MSYIAPPKKWTLDDRPELKSEWRGQKVQNFFIQIVCEQKISCLIKRHYYTVKRKVDPHKYLDYPHQDPVYLLL